MARINVEEAKHYQNELNGEWFGLKDHGDVARVQFMIDKYEDIDVFACHKVEVNGKERYVDCLRTYNEPIDKCPLCASGYPVKPVRFVVMYQHDDQKVKIWERGKNFIAKLQGLCNRYQPLSEYVFEIERNGAKGSKETKYEVFPMDRVDPVDLSEIEKPDLLGGLIIDASADDMEVYLQTGNFPEKGSEDSAPIARRGAENSNPNPSGARRSTPASAQTSEPPSRRGAGTPASPRQTTSRRREEF